MKPTATKCALAIFACAAAQAVASERDEPVRVYVQSLTPHVAQQVKERAAEGQASLMQYLWFTRKYHSLWLEDVMKAPKDEVIAMGREERRAPVVFRTTGQR